MNNTERERKIALFIDFENIAIGVNDAKYKKFEVSLLLERLLEKGKIVVKRAYCDWDKFPDYKRELHEAAADVAAGPGDQQLHGDSPRRAVPDPAKT